MEDRAYTWKRRDGWASPVELNVLMGVASAKVVSGRGPFTLTQDGEPIARDKPRLEVLQRFRTAISQRDIGHVFRIRKGNGETVLTARAVRKETLPIDSTNGNRHADEFYNWVLTNYSEYHPRYAGAYVCKPSSQHAYGNAVDFFFDTLAHQDKVFDDVRAGKCPTPIAHAISERSIWSPTGGTHYYGGNFHAHLHVDFSPQYSGYCGVRG